MVDKKPAKPTPATTAMKPVPANITRHSIPSLSPLPGQKPDFKAAAAGDAPAAEASTSGQAAQPASAPATPTAAPSVPAKATENLGPKMRSKGEILAALRAGSHVLHTESGLCRIVEANGTVHPASKRRVRALIDQGILKPTEADKRKYVLDAAADAKAQAPKPPASTTAPAKSESPAWKSDAPASGTAEGTK